MTDCLRDHTAWVEVTSASISNASQNLRLTNSNRLGELVNALENPTQKYPQIILCIGRKNRQTLAASLFPDHNRSYLLEGSHQSPACRLSSISSSSSGISSIHVDKSQIEPEILYPIILADYDPAATASEERRCRCCDVRSHEVGWLQPIAGVNDLAIPDINNIILSRLIFPFSGLICLFAEDFGGVHAVVGLIREWSTTSRATDLPYSALPRVCVIACGPLTPDLQIQTEVFEAGIRNIRYRHMFSNVSLLYFGQSSDLEFHANLRETITDQLRVINNARDTAQVRFNAVHLVDFFSQAVSHLAGTIDKPFSYVRASRTYRPVPTAYKKQIGTLFSLARSQRIKPYIITKLIASCLLLDAYPQGCHGNHQTCIHGRQLSSLTACSLQ